MILDYNARQNLINRALCKIGAPASEDDESIRRIILLTVAEEFAGSQMTFKERIEIAGELFNAMRGLDILQPLMDDPQVTEIMVNGPESVFYEKSGKLNTSGIRFCNRAHLTGVITNFFGRANKMIHEHKPLADMRLPGGERVHAALPPAAPDGPVLTIRKFSGFRPDMKSLVEGDFITEEAADMLISAVRHKKTIFICGGTGTGKTTFLNILSGFIADNERVVTIEDAAELSLQGLSNLVRLETRHPGPDGSGEVSITELIRASLRMRPDRIIVGEVRGREAYDMLQAMNTGHPGSLCTGHGNSCRNMLERLTLMVMLAVQLPWSAVIGLVSSAIDIIIHLVRTCDGKRQVNEICQVAASEIGQYVLKPQYIRSGGGELENVENGWSQMLFEEI